MILVHPFLYRMTLAISPRYVAAATKRHEHREGNERAVTSFGDVQLPSANADTWRKPNGSFSTFCFPCRWWGHRLGFRVKGWNHLQIQSPRRTSWSSWAAFVSWKVDHVRGLACDFESSDALVPSRNPAFYLNPNYFWAYQCGCCHESSSPAGCSSGFEFGYLFEGSEASSLRQILQDSTPTNALLSVVRWVLVAIAVCDKISRSKVSLGIEFLLPYGGNPTFRAWQNTWPRLLAFCSV